MSYSDFTRLGESFDIDSQLSTSFIYSDAIQADGKIVEIQIRCVGGSGDSDDVEVYQFNSLASNNGLFDTEGKSLGTITLNSTTEVVKSFSCFINRSFKIGLKMESGSAETPNYRGSYTINSSVDNVNFQ